MVLFGFVTLFNGISTLMGYLIPKLSVALSNPLLGDKEVHFFFKSISSKVKSSNFSCTGVRTHLLRNHRPSMLYFMPRVLLPVVAVVVIVIGSVVGGGFLLEW